MNDDVVLGTGLSAGQIKMKLNELKAKADRQRMLNGVFAVLILILLMRKK